MPLRSSLRSPTRATPASHRPGRPLAPRGAAALIVVLSVVMAWVMTLVLLAALPAGAARRAAPERSTDSVTLRGEVIAVIDGDTLVVLDAQREAHRIRLAGIDAPERDQAHGDVARHALVDWVQRRQVLVTGHKFDRWQRLVGRVWLAGEDLNLRLVGSGHAWHDRMHLAEQTEADQQRYAAAEAAARRDRLGLWAAPDPTPPVVFRRLKSLGQAIDATSP